MEGSVAELATPYRRHLERWAELKSAGLVDRANDAVEDAHGCAKRLRATAAGRAALEALLEHPDPEIKNWIAVEVIPFDPDRACDVLRDGQDSGGPGSFDAQATLEAFEAGELNPDWQMSLVRRRR
jgi:hypothetical protein